jgi:lysophospholipase L1-like esterase
MTLYPYVAALAVDPVSLVAAKGATGQIFAPTDTSFASPLTASDATGNPIPLTANADGILPSFYATLPAVNWRSGSFVFPLVTSQPLEGPKGDPGAPGIDGVDGSNVIPTDVAIAEAIQNPSSAASSAVGTSVAAKVRPVIRLADTLDADRAFDPPPAEDVPVISVTTGPNGSVTTISSGVLFREKRVDNVSNGNLDIAGDSRFRYKGFPAGVPNGASTTNFVNTTSKPGAPNAYWHFGIEFDTASKTVEFRMRPVSANTDIGICKVNGRWVTQDNIPGMDTTGGLWQWVKLTFPDSRPRRIEAMGFGYFGGFGGVAVEQGQTIIKPNDPIRRRIAFIGASLVDGSGMAPTGAWQAETYAYRLAYLMGADEIVSAGVGGTGYVAAIGGNTASRYGGRIAAVLAMNPDVIVFEGSRNDPAGNEAESAVLRQAVADAMAAVSSIPEVYVAGVLSGGSSDPRNVAVREAAQAAGRPFIDLSTTITGVGKTTAPAGDGGNADLYVGSDGVHPIHAGHKLLAKRFYNALRTHWAA